MISRSRRLLRRKLISKTTMLVSLLSYLLSLEIFWPHGKWSKNMVLLIANVLVLFYNIRFRIGVTSPCLMSHCFNHLPIICTTSLYQVRSTLIFTQSSNPNIRSPIHRRTKNMHSHLHIQRQICHGAFRVAHEATWWEERLLHAFMSLHYITIDTASICA